jgi:hypothetical protein
MKESEVDVMAFAYRDGKRLESETFQYPKVANHVKLTNTRTIHTVTNFI